ncbi:DUF4276 family protein [Candidatus Venteria ishoeyi]|uniref:DUF4276 family protein n=1 Tax=Candidatus Venteria ishoeyi TaxID=1899563 RepID=A0A1H6FH18_9GAMM|nr:DUF4276 family protein [Candidatus Venteria ishoeyi]MDM8547379.1 DUF4276 family protein [Candidatus Venteria ishoeyi]SEH08731.1 Uncharacterised protein [Candidatus Venteria ishoeyi]
MVVKVGFVVEGDCEKILIESKHFRDWAVQYELEICDPVIDVRGGGNLCPQQIQPYVELCQKQANPDKIVVLTDLECEPCITQARQRIGIEHIDLLCIACKALESWYLADTEALQKWMEKKVSEHKNPELSGTEKKPWDELKCLANKYKTRGPGKKKPIFTRKMLNDYGFSLQRAAAHPACPSAQYFLKKLAALTQ